MVEHEINVEWYLYSIGAVDSNKDWALTDHKFSDFANTQDCVRFAIVQAVINRLKGNV